MATYIVTKGDGTTVEVKASTNSMHAIQEIARRFESVARWKVQRKPAQK